MASTYTRDSVYYFKNVVFHVGNTIFQVPRNKFEVPGTIFEAMFSLPNAEEGGATLEGSTDENPIVLPVDEKHFKGFLGALYPFANDKGMSSDDWIGALDLATMWMFTEIREKAIDALSDWVTKTDAREGVLLAKKYKVLNWLKASYCRLLQQTSLKIDELSGHPAFDWETIARLLYVKQDILILMQKRGGHNYYCNNCNQHTYGVQFCSKCYSSPLLEDVFQTEFESMCPESVGSDKSEPDG